MAAAEHPERRARCHTRTGPARARAAAEQRDRLRAQVEKRVSCASARCVSSSTSANASGVAAPPCRHRHRPARLPQRLGFGFTAIGGASAWPRRRPRLGPGRLGRAPIVEGDQLKRRLGRARGGWGRVGGGQRRRRVCAPRRRVRRRVGLSRFIASAVATNRPLRSCDERPSPVPAGRARAVSPRRRRSARGRGSRVSTNSVRRHSSSSSSHSSPPSGRSPRAGRPSRRAPRSRRSAHLGLRRGPTMAAVTSAYSSTVSPALSRRRGRTRACTEPPPPMTPCSSRVSTESRYGTWRCPLASAVSTRPSASSDTLIFARRDVVALDPPVDQVEARRLRRAPRAPLERQRQQRVRAARVLVVLVRLGHALGERRLDQLRQRGLLGTRAAAASSASIMPSAARRHRAAAARRSATAPRSGRAPSRWPPRQDARMLYDPMRLQRREPAGELRTPAVSCGRHTRHARSRTHRAGGHMSAARGVQGGREHAMALHRRDALTR